MNKNATELARVLNKFYDFFLTECKGKLSPYFLTRLNFFLFLKKGVSRPKNRCKKGNKIFIYK